MPKVSIVVPVYNSEKYLDACLESIYKQTFQDWECIIWNDGSTDNSIKIIQYYIAIDERFFWGESKINHGLSATLNLAYSFSTGQYLCQVDSDDLLLPLTLDKCVKYLDEHKEIDLIFTNKLYINENDSRFFEHCNNKEHYSRIKLFYSSPLITHFRLMKRKVWEKLGGYKNEITFGEDDDFGIRAAWGVTTKNKRIKPFKIQKIKSICYIYRIREGSMSHSIRDDNNITENREFLKKLVLWSWCKFWRIKILIEQIRWDIYLMEKGEK